MAAAAPRRGRAPDSQRPVSRDRIEIRRDPLKGRGVFARKAIDAGALIETAPVVIVPADQRPRLEDTILRDYYFVWDEDSDGRAAIALGLVSLCNHSRRPSARVRRNRAGETLDLLALTPLAAGSEITIDYNCPLWFSPRD
jgi:SET domain-containing protein